MSRATQNQMRLAIRKLMSQKKLNDITVNDIVAEADINRKTFYYHYHSIFDLLAEIVKDDIEKIIGSEPISPKNWQRIALKILAYIRKNSRFFRAIQSSRYHAEFNSFIMGLFREKVDIFSELAVQIYEKEHSRHLQLTSQQMAYISRYYTAATYGMVQQWIASGMTESEEEFIHLLSLLNKDHMYQTIELMDSYNRSQNQNS